MQRTSEMREEYQKMQIRKAQEKETKGKRSKFDDDFGTFKIGSENRMIKKKTYDEHMNSLVLNPTREQSRQSEQYGSRQRGKSNQPSYNIINHTNYNNGFENDMKYIEYEKNQPKQPVHTQPIHNQQPVYNQMPNYEDVSYKNHENQNYENLENYDKHYEGKNEIDEAEYQKYYQEYLNSLREANSKEHPNYENELTAEMNKMNINDQYRPSEFKQNDYKSNSEYKPEYVPNEYKPEYVPNDYKQNEYKPIENKQNTTQNEYMMNKFNNQKGNNIHNIEGEMGYENNKAENQRMYKSYLDAQTKDKRNPVETNTNERFILKKDRSVAANPCNSLLI